MSLRSFFSRAWRSVRELMRPVDHAEMTRHAVTQLSSMDATSRRIPQIHETLTKMSPQEIFRTKSGAEMRLLANYAYYGVGTEKDISLATGLWAQAAAKGDLESMYSLAQCMLRGVGLIQEMHGGPYIDGAIELLETIVRQVEHGPAFYSLATALLTKHRADTSEAGRVARQRARDLFIRAAKLNVHQAALNVANIYLYGLESERNEEEGLKWLSHAARLGDAHAQAELAQRFFTGAGVPENQERAVKLWQKLGEKGHGKSLYNAGVSYLLGTGVEQDDSRAAHYFLEATKHDFPPAKINLAVMMAEGRGMPQDFDGALDMLRELQGAGFQEVEETIRYIEGRKRLSETEVDGSSLAGLAPDEASIAGQRQIEPIMQLETEKHSPDARTVDVGIIAKVSAAELGPILEEIGRLEARGMRREMIARLRKAEEDGLLTVTGELADLMKADAQRKAREGGGGRKGGSGPSEPER